LAGRDRALVLAGTEWGWRLWMAFAWQGVVARRKILWEVSTSMPVYEYLCRKCGKSFERIETVKEHDLSKVNCPECKSKKVERRWSSVFAVTSKKS
jgi:putative FmdB family regulatory protein